MITRDILITPSDIETLRGVRKEIFNLYIKSEHPWDKNHYSVMLRRLDNVITRGNHE